jgi:uncharacterized membrane protein
MRNDTTFRKRAVCDCLTLRGQPKTCGKPQTSEYVLMTASGQKHPLEVRVRCFRFAPLGGPHLKLVPTASRATSGRDVGLYSSVEAMTLVLAMIDDLAFARIVHLLAIVHWIGGMAAVTTIVLPGASRFGDAEDALGAFQGFERRFAQQVRISVMLTGISGIYMLWRLAAWERLTWISFWWLDLMVAFWILFALVLFLIEPLWMDKILRFHVLRDKNRTFALMRKLHWVALGLASLTIAAGTLGAHGYLPP